MIVNIETLLPSLLAGGVACEGCTSDGVVQFTAKATDADRATAAAILAAHDPSPTLDQKLAKVGLTKLQAALVLRVSDKWSALTSAQQAAVLKVLNAAASDISNLF